MSNQANTIVREAIQMINEHGTRSLSLRSLASRLEISRATIYNHISNREELYSLCFRQSIEAGQSRLDQAIESSDNALEQVLSYVEASLVGPGKSWVAMLDTSVLEGDRREEIDEIARAHSRALTTLIETGIEKEQIRSCNASVVAQVLRSMTAFLGILPRWFTAHPIDPSTIVDFIRYGIAADRRYEFEFDDDTNQFSRLANEPLGMPKLADMRREQVLATGSNLINRSGLENVTLNQVAKALGATRGTVYHYVKDREDLLAQCFGRGFDFYDAFHNYADEVGCTGIEKASILSHLNVQAHTGSLQPALPWMGLDASSDALRELVQGRMTQILQISNRFAQEGIEDGSRRAADGTSIAIARAGGYLWTPRWLEEIKPPLPARRVADEIVRLFNVGIAPV